MSSALVTGAAKGIGRAIAEELAIRKYHLILVDKDADELYACTRVLESRYIVQVIPLHIDLTSDGGVEQLISFTQPYHEWLNVVVNNAGYGLKDSFEQISISDQLTIIEFNIKAFVKISHAYVPVLKKFDNGYLLNVAGTQAAYKIASSLNIYESTKAFVLSFTHGIQQELRNTNLSVSCLNTRTTKTSFINKSKKIAAKYSITPETIANAAINGLFKREPEIVPGFANKLNVFFAKLLPARSARKITTTIHNKSDHWIDPAMDNVSSRLFKIKHRQVRHESIY